MITLEDVIKDEEVEAFVKASQKQLNALGYTEHSYRNCIKKNRRNSAKIGI